MKTIILENKKHEFCCDIDRNGYGEPIDLTPKSISEAFLHRAISHCNSPFLSTGIVYRNHVKMDLIIMLPTEKSEMIETVKLIKSHKSFNDVNKVYKQKIGKELLDFILESPLKF